MKDESRSRGNFFVEDCLWREGLMEGDSKEKIYERSKEKMCG